MRSLLVIEDDESMALLFREVFALEGFDVTHARNGRDALARLESATPDVILLDMRMPVMDGWEFTRCLRERFPQGAPPIVVVSAAEDLSRRVAEAGAVCGVGKPFELRNLTDAVHRALGNGASP